MSTLSILGILFVIELALVASALAIYLFFQLKNLKLRFRQRNAAQEGEEHDNSSLKRLFDVQIIRTRKKITERVSAESQSEDEIQKQNSLLNQRIEFLQLEKEVLDEHITDGSYWKKLCDGISGLLGSHEAETVKTETNAVDEEKYKRRIANYQAQLDGLRNEFEEYRKRSVKLTTELSKMASEKDQDKALNELMADFKDHDDQLNARLGKLQAENEKLHANLSKAEQEIYAGEYKKNKALHEGDLELTSKTASEEELGRLRDIISRQYGTIDELKSAIQNSEPGELSNEFIEEKIQAVAQSQSELQTCIEVLEMENQRLTDALAEAQSNEGGKQPESTPQELFDLRLESKELHDQVNTLNNQLAEKDEKIQELEKEHENLQKEFMQMYAQQGS